jgi:hypothetical protein
VTGVEDAVYSVRSRSALVYRQYLVLRGDAQESKRECSSRQVIIAEYPASFEAEASKSVRHSRARDFFIPRAGAWAYQYFCKDFNGEHRLREGYVAQWPAR